MRVWLISKNYWLDKGEKGKNAKASSAGFGFDNTSLKKKTSNDGLQLVRLIAAIHVCLIQ